MRLLIGDKFFESLIRLPKSTQKKVIDFQKKFKDNPQSAAINLENISTFKDNNLRTARVDKKYRAIIGSVKGRDDYYLLWVDNHDEAMDWARNKTFEWNDVINSPQIFTLSEGESGTQSESGSSYEMNVSAQQPETGAETPAGLSQFTAEQLLQLGVPKALLPRVREVSSIGALEKVEADLPEDVFEHLFYLLDGLPYEKVLEEVTESAAHSDGDSPAFRRFYVEADDALLSRMVNGELAKWSLFLHPSQRALVETDFKGTVKVTGGAGTGKTVAALHRLAFLCNKKPGPSSVLFATYTNALKRNLGRQIQMLNIPQQTCVLSTIDSTAISLAKEFGLINTDTAIAGMGMSVSGLELWEKVLEDVVSDLDPDFLDTELHEVIYFYNLKERRDYLRQTRFGRRETASRKLRIEVWKLYEMYQAYKAENGIIDREELFNRVHDFLNDNPDKRPYRHVILDEVQDCSNVELRFIRSLVPEGENDLFLVGDPYQSIYAKEINFSRAGINVRGRRSKRLKVNYRTTEEIKRYALAALEGVRYTDFDEEEESLKGYLSLFHGEKPVYQVFDDFSKETGFIINEINTLTSEHESSINPSDIVIATRTQNSLKTFITAFHQQKIPYYHLRDEIGVREGVHFCTFHSLKGLEYKVVLLADISEQTYPLKPSSYTSWSAEKKERYLKSEKSLLYTAMTRAIARLYLTGTGREAPIGS